MGRYRQQLIYLVSVLVAVNLAASVVVLDARIDRASEVSPEARTTSPTPPSVGAPRGGTATHSGSVLASGSFGHRRRPSGQATTQATPATGSTGTTAPASSSPATNASTRPPVVSTGGSSPSRERPAAPRAGQPTTTSTAGPGSRSTPPPGATQTGEPATAADEPPSGAGAAPDNTPATGKAAPTKTTTPSYSSGVWTVVDDATGDTVIDDKGTPQSNPRADIVQSRVANTTKAIGFSVKVAEPVDPLRDPNWASPATFVEWEVDTNGDGTADFSVQYFVEGGKLIGGVYKAGNTAGQPACEAEAGYMSDTYVAGVDPGCLGSPASLSYRASIYYSTDPKNENADVITDASPDGAMSGQVARTAA